MKETTLTIGIPAYNEEANIVNLLKNLLAQKIDDIILDKIIVISDASSDNTVQKAKDLQHTKIHIIENKTRQGKPKIQNILFKKSNSDLLVILDADVLPLKKNFLEKLIEPFYNNQSLGLIGAYPLSTKPKTSFEKIIADSHLFKTTMYEEINNGDNIYLCHGRARAFKKNFYKQLLIPADCSQEDAYTYLTCKQKGFSFTFAKNAIILFTSPATLTDHAKQSARFHQGRKKLDITIFDKNIVNNVYEIPNLIFIKHLILFFIQKPFSAISYLTIQSYLALFNPIKQAHKGAWNVSTSTKIIDVK